MSRRNDPLSPLAVRSYETRDDSGRRTLPPGTVPARSRSDLASSRSAPEGQTQVFMILQATTTAPDDPHAGDRRLARGVARALRLKEDRSRRSGSATRTGAHTVRHAGEEALDAVLQERLGKSFRHNEQSLRIAESLNLTEEVRDGILTHTADAGARDARRQVVGSSTGCLINHDIDDAVRLGPRSGGLPHEEVALLGDGAPGHRHAGARPGRNLRASRGNRQSEEIGEAMLALRSFMSRAVYLGPHTRQEQERARARYGDLRAPRERGEEPEQIIEFIAGRPTGSRCASCGVG